MFEKAFNGELIEGRTQTYTLEDVSPEVFRLVQQWLYFQKLTLSVHDEDKPDNPAEKGHKSKCSHQDMVLVKLWVFAQKFCMDRLQNAVIDHMVRIQRKCGRMNPRCFEYIYKNTADGSPLRHLAVDQVAWSAPSFLANQEDRPHEMLLELVFLFAEQLPQSVRKRKNAEMTAEDYHVTEDYS